jgi:exodeoxyribonuclease V alpha subunit
LDKLTGTVKSIIFRNAENGYSVIEITDDNGDEHTVVGSLPLVTVGERAEFTGEWMEHPTYGPQLKAKSSQTIAPATLGALINYLGSGLIKGVGEATARDIVSTFGMETLNVLEKEPERLREVPGIGRIKASKIALSFAMQKGMRDVMLSLQEFGITVAQSMKLYNTYGDLCIAKLKENPYRLIDDIEGIGFITADKLAVKAGFEPDSPFRIKAGLKYTLQWARQEGHTFLPRERLISVACQLLQADELPAEKMLDELIISGDVLYKLIDNVDSVFLPGMYSAESECAHRIMNVASRDSMQLMLGLNAQINALEKELKIPLAPQQRKAVETALKSGAMVITGGPGTGKTTILKFIIRLLERMGLDYQLCAPTGRAAKRMSEATGTEARTIHRMLGYGASGDKFLYDEDNPLLTDVIIVDEMSMVDVLLMRALLRATPSGTHLIMVGDADQLPPVGPGNVLRDIIASGVVPVIRLTDIFRQAERGMIVENAHRINNGKQPDLFAGSDDFCFEEISGAEQIIRRVIALNSGKTNKLSTNEPIKDVQVLVPMKKGALGAINLNTRLQAALNPPSPAKKERKQGEITLREGDKVMQTKNDYKIPWKRTKTGEEGTGVFNGDLGTVERIDLSEQEVTVLFDDERAAAYDYSMLDELSLAYAATVHKSQGSEYPVVIMPLAGGAPQLMTRNLLYTAVTRAREQVYILGSSKCVYDMVNNNQIRRRYSALKCLLMELDTVVLDGK